MFFFLLLQDFWDAHCWNSLELCLVDFLDRVATILEQVHEVHHLLFSKFEVVDLVIQVGAVLCGLSDLLLQFF